MTGQQTFFLSSGEFSIAVTVFLPDSPVRGTALLLPPLMEERKGALPFLVSVAREAAKKGIVSAAFDFAGTGDSEGDFAKIPFRQTETDIDTVYNWLEKSFPLIPHLMCGIRAGATLAMRYAKRKNPCAGVLAWSPLSGTDFLRNLFQRRMVNDMVAYGKARESRATLERTLASGGTVDLDGYSLSADFYEGLRTLSSGTPDCPLLITPKAAPYPPFWNTVGHVDLTQLVSESIAWLDSMLPGGDSKQTEIDPSLIPDASRFLGETKAFPKARMIFDLPGESPISGALFLHGWSGDRTGPHRLFTRFARTLTARGVICLRPDFPGRGWSDGNAKEASIAGMVRTAEEALNILRARLPANAPVHVIAICSGCKVAITLASLHPDLAGLILWSAESMGDLRSAATGKNKLFHSLSSYAKKLLRPETWKKILTGNIHSSLVLQALATREVRSEEEAKEENRTLVRFRAFRNPVHFIFGGSDPDAKKSAPAYENFCRSAGIPFTMDTIPHAGHSYYGEDWTQQLFSRSLKAGKPSLF